MINVDECLGQQAEGFLLGTLLCRHILQGAGCDREVIDTINHQSLQNYLEKLSDGDFIVQDQVLSGLEFDPEAESSFQNMATQLLTVFDQAKANPDESLWRNPQESGEDS